jgi:hypothetical protein
MLGGFTEQIQTMASALYAQGKREEALALLASFNVPPGPNWPNPPGGGESSQGEGENPQGLQDRLQQMQAEASRGIESALQGVDISSAAAPPKRDLHPAKVQAARAQAAYLATARTSQLRPMGYLAELQPSGYLAETQPIGYLATAGTQLHPGKIQAARAQAAYLTTTRSAGSAYLGTSAPYLATAATSLHPMKVQAARSQAAYLGTARTAETALRAPSGYLTERQPIAYLATAGTELHPGKIQAARAQASYLATARTTRTPGIDIFPYLATSETSLHPKKVQAARAQAAYLTTARGIAKPALTATLPAVAIGAYLASPYLATAATQLHGGKVQAARAQAAYLATARSITTASSGQPSPPEEISIGAESEQPSTPQRGEISAETRTKINQLVTLQKALRALRDE